MNLSRSTWPLIAATCSIALSIICVGYVYRVISYQHMYEKHLQELTAHMPTVEQSAPAPQPTHIIEKIVDKSQIWRPVQERIRNTVVQIFAQRAVTDVLLPFRAPELYSVSGSGFFINDEGDIVTNAHVVDQATALWIQVPSLGKRIIDVSIIGVSPERDLALLRVAPHDQEMLRKELGGIPFLILGDSDTVRRADEVLALGYPLGQQALKSTTGIISGREQHLIQMSAPINPGSSGGPLLNIAGEVVGVNSSGIIPAQNVGYSIPSNDLKNILPDLYKVKLLRKPFLGFLFSNANESLTSFLGNPPPGGCYVIEVVKGSTLDAAGIQSGDMIYEINGYPLDIYGEMTVPWGEDKISVIDFVGRLSCGQDLRIVFYRKGQRLETNVKFSQASLPAIRVLYPQYDEIDYEIFGGMVVMQLSLNHIHLLAKNSPGLARFAEIQHQAEPVLVITHIFPNSQLYRSRTLSIGATLNEINGIPVKTLKDFRSAIEDSLRSGYFTIRASDNITRASDNIFVVLPFAKLLEEEHALGHTYKYPTTSTAKAIMDRAHSARA